MSKNQNKIDEGTAALDSVKTKPQDLAGIISKINGDSGPDVVNKFKEVQAQIGHEADSISPELAKKNKASVDTKIKAVTKEDMDTVFGEEITEEIREKTFTLFEAAVSAKVHDITVDYEEAYVSALAEAIDELDAAYAEQINDYLNLVSESWLEDNKLAVEKSIKAEISEDFIAGLKNLFIEHNISIPEDKIDVVEQLSVKNDDLTAKLDEALNELIQTKAEISEIAKNIVFDDISEDLAKTQKEKFRNLAENVNFSTKEDYLKKLTLIKEAHFSDKSVKKDTGLIIEDVPAIDPENETAKTIASNPAMTSILEALGRTTQTL